MDGCYTTIVLDAAITRKQRKKPSGKWGRKEREREQTFIDY